MKIAIIGTGYVGLVTGVGFAKFGHDVVCVDQDERRINALNEGRSPIFEPEIETMIARNLARLRFTTNYTDMAECELIFVCVGTPAGPDGSANMDSFWSAIESIYFACGEMHEATIAVKSTVPIGTHMELRNWFLRRPHHFCLASCPEFLKEGDAVRDFSHPDRVVIGSFDSPDRLVQAFRPFVRTPDQIMVTDPTSAEMIKYAANAMLATRISFMNELSRLADLCGGNIDEVRRGIGSDSRIGDKFLYAGMGYGGSCFPKDVQALVATARKYETEVGVVEAAIEANEIQQMWFYDQIAKNVKGGTIAIWGCSFKPETDDVRESPAIHLAAHLADQGYMVRMHDPVALDNTRGVLGEAVEYATSSYACARDADALVLATEWAEYRRPDFRHLMDTMHNGVFFDGRNVWPSAAITALGGEYFGVGRP